MKNKKPIKNFQDLEVYQLSLNLTKRIYQLIEKFPKSERYGIIDQLRRSVSSIGANITEGFGRYHRKEFIKFLYNARGSLMETHHHLILSYELDYINKNDFDIFEKDILKIGVKLNNLIGSISKHNK